MKKVAAWLAAIALIVFVIDWGLIGLKLLDGDFDITLGTYVGLVCIVIGFVCVMIVKLSNRCPQCRRMIQYNWAYCPYCGQKIK